MSRTVTELVAGSGLTSEDRGERTLKAIQETWRFTPGPDRTLILRDGV